MSNDDTNSPTRPAATQRRRRYPWILLALALMVAGVVAAAPALLSTPWARQAAVDWYNGTIPGELAVGDLSLSWLGGQSARAVTVRDASGEPVITLEAFTTDLSLLGALRRRLSLGETVISGLNVDLRFGEDGTSNLARALGAADTASPEPGGGPVVPVTGNMALTDSRVAITAPGIEPVVLENLEGKVEMAGLDTPTILSFSGLSRQGELRGSISVDGTVNGLFADGVLTPAKAVMAVQARIEELPVDALDQLLGAGGLLTAALGDRTSLNLEASGDARRQELSLDASAPNGNLVLRGAVTDGRFQLTGPARAELQATPALVEKALGPDSDPAFRLADEVPLRLDIERLDVPLAPFSLSGAALKGSVHAPKPVHLTDLKEIGDVALNDLQLRVGSESLGESVSLSLSGEPVTGGQSGTLTLDARLERLFDDAGNLQPERFVVTGQSNITGIPTALVDTLLGQNGLLVAAIGPKMGLALEAEANAEGNIGVGLKIDSERLQTENMAFTMGDDLTLTRPARARFTLSPALWHALMGDDPGHRLAGPAALTLDLNNMRLPLPRGSVPALVPGKTQLQGTLSAESLSVVDTAGVATRLDNLMVDLGGGSLEAMDVQLSGELIQSDGMLAALDASPLRVSLEARTGLDEALVLKKITAALTLDSPGLRTTLNAAVDAGFNRFNLTAPATLNAVVTPALLAATRDSDGSAASLQRPANIEASIDTLTFGLSPFSYAGTSAEGSARIDILAVQAPGGVATDIESMNLAFSFQGQEGGLAKLNADARVRPSGGEGGDLAVSATAGNLVDGAGQLSTESLSLELDGTLQRLPVALVDQLLNMEGLAVATLGDTADFGLNARLEKRRGPVSVSLNSPNTRADIKARLQDSGLTLTEPLKAQVQPTPEFGSQVLAKVHPVFETLQRSEHPIRFEIPAEGVLIPVQNYDFSAVRVPEMTMDFGKLVLKSGWLLRGVIGLSQQFGKLDSVQKEEWEAWFTPGIMEVKDGRVLYKRRLDLLLAQKLHLATWGSADIAADRSNLVLAFMPDTMERVFSITVSGNDALRVPIEGPLSNPGIDYKKAARDLGRLRAQEEVAGENPLAAVLLGAAAGKTADDGAVPPASVSPLPWAAELEARDAAEIQQQGNGAAAPPPAETGQTDQAGEQQASPDKRPSTEEQVIKGLIDIFGKKKQ